MWLRPAVGSRSSGAGTMQNENSHDGKTTGEQTANKILADGGVSRAQFYQLTGFQRDILRAIYELEESEDTSYGLAIKDHLETTYGEPVNHGRLYPNLDDLVNDGFVAKSELDKRTNAYTLTQTARQLLQHITRVNAAMMLDDYSPKNSALNRTAAMPDGGPSGGGE